MYRVLGASLIVLAACHGATPPTAKPIVPGMIAGLVRHAHTGEAVERAIVVVRRPGEIAPLRHFSDDNGAFMIADLPPGHYDVVAYVDQLAIGERADDVRAGQMVGLDFTVRHDLDPPDLNAPGAPSLWRYRPPGADPTTGVIAGTVADLRFQRVAVAVVTVTVSGTVDAQQTVTDGHGRFELRDLAPGSYDVSAEYAVLRRGQIEVRRSRVIVAGGEVVVVPLWLDTETPPQ